MVEKTTSKFDMTYYFALLEIYAAVRELSDEKYDDIEACYSIVSHLVKSFEDIVGKDFVSKTIEVLTKIKATANSDDKMQIVLDFSAYTLLPALSTYGH